MKKIMYTLIIILSLTSFAYAEPNATIKYLMKENVTLLDLGIYKLRKQLQNLTISHVKEYEYKHKEKEVRTVKLYTDVSYVWDNNRIIVFSEPEPDGIYSFIAASLSEAKSICHKINQRIHSKIQMGLIFDSTFSHEGYKDKDQPDNLDYEVLKIIHFKSKVRYREKDDNLKDPAPLLRCQAPFFDQNISYSE